MSIPKEVMPCAILHSKCGELCIYDIEALCKMVLALPDMSILPAIAPPTATSDPQLLEGFSITQWAKYAKHKAKIASSVCRENGLLKKSPVMPSAPRFHTDCEDCATQDMIFVKDPWSSAVTENTLGSISTDCQPTALIEVGDWSDWCPGAPCSPSPDDADKEVLQASSESCAKDDIPASSCPTARGTLEHKSEHRVLDPGDVLYDVRCKSWDRTSLCKLWNGMNAKFGDECADAVGPWLEDRYFQKQGQRTVNMDTCLELSVTGKCQLLLPDYAIPRLVTAAILNGLVSGSAFAGILST